MRREGTRLYFLVAAVLNDAHGEVRKVQVVVEEE